VLALSRIVLALASLVGGIVALMSGDFGLVVAALALAALGFIPVSLLMMPGLLLFGALGAVLGRRMGDSPGKGAMWVAATLGTLNSSVVQVAWLFICLSVLGGATDGGTPPWAAGLLVIGASYGVWEWLAQKDLQGGNPASTVQLAHFGMGLTLFYLTLMLAPDAVVLAFVLLGGAQLTSIPRILEMEELLSVAQAAATPARLDPTTEFFKDFEPGIDNMTPDEWPDSCSWCGEPAQDKPDDADSRVYFCPSCGGRVN
jgi:hypothetical protein